MSRMECICCHKQADARTFLRCSDCGAPLCDDCASRGCGLCDSCSDGEYDK